MRTFSAILLALGLGLMTSAAGLDEPARPKPPVPMQKYSSARDAVRSGVRDYNAGDKAGAARALEYAAGKGHALARWKLGRMHAEGDGVPHDDLKAFRYFSRIAAENCGRVVKLMGNRALVEVASVVDAMNAAVEIQRALAA